VILPTYNEREALGALKPRLDAVLRPYSSEVLVVDDDSPDGTAEFVRSLGEGSGWRLHLREGSRGLATAVLDGFASARGEVIVVMDADGSHPPETIPRLVEPIRERAAEFSLASRFVPGGSDEGLRGVRRLISWGATAIARPLSPVHDPMSGFFAMRRSVIDGAELAPVGYKIGLEVLVRCRPRPVVEVPFAFVPRLAGTSKLGSRQILGYLRHALRLYRWRFLGPGRASRTR